MKIKTNSGLIYDSKDSRCYFEEQVLTNRVSAGFVQCYDERTGHQQRYCGEYQRDNAEKSIEDIMNKGHSFDRLIKNWITEIEPKNS